MSTPRPVPGLLNLAPYDPGRLSTPCDLHLDGNECDLSEGEGSASTGATREILYRYPDLSFFERQIAESHQVEPEQVLLTAGADDGLYRACRTVLMPGRSFIFPSPSFGMLRRYAEVSGATVVRVPWTSDEYPIDEVIASIDETTAAIAVVSPNNPTGAVAVAEDLQRLSTAAPGALLLVDLAYAEFAEEDLTPVARDLDNALIFRTFSKAWGLAGLRVGYVFGPPRVIRWMRSLGQPYAVSGLSASIACERWKRDRARVESFARRVRLERRELAEMLASCGARPQPSQANFILARFDDAAFVREGLAGLGIAVRAFAGDDEVEDALRITCPGRADAFARLLAAIETTMRPKALLFDLDGVLADVSHSYREAIVLTARFFGVEVSAEEVARIKRAGGANDDWEVTHRLIAAHCDVSYAEVRRRFETFYQGDATQPGLRQRETLIPDRAVLEHLSRKVRLALVTGRPRSDALHFIRHFDLDGLFEVAVTRDESVALKPDPAPVLLALDKLGTRSAWMVGDTPDDMRAARAARTLPLGIVSPGEDLARTGDALLRAGAGRVLGSLDEILEILP